MLTLERLKNVIAEAMDGLWLPTAFAIVCAIALGFQMDAARRYESLTHRYSIVFPWGWKDLPKSRDNIYGNADAYFGNGKGPSAAVFVHVEAREPLGAADSILAQAKKDDGTVEVKERRRYEREGRKYERLVFYSGDFGHHYTFVYTMGKEFVISANCVKRDFPSHEKSFDSISDSLNASDVGCKLPAKSDDRADAKEQDEKEIRRRTSEQVSERGDR